MSEEFRNLAVTRSPICSLRAPGGWNNVGLIVNGQASLLINTLFDEKLNDLRDAAG